MWDPKDCAIVYNPSNLDAVITAAWFADTLTNHVYSIDEIIPNGMTSNHWTVDEIIADGIQTFFWLGIKPDYESNEMLQKRVDANNYFVNVTPKGTTKPYQYDSIGTGSFKTKGSKFAYDLEEIYLKANQGEDPDTSAIPNSIMRQMLYAYKPEYIGDNAATRMSMMLSRFHSDPTDNIEENEKLLNEKIFVWEVYLESLKTLRFGSLLLLDDPHPEEQQRYLNQYNLGLKEAKRLLNTKSYTAKVQQGGKDGRFIDVVWMSIEAERFPLVELRLKQAGKLYCNVTVGINGVTIQTNVHGLKIEDGAMLHHVIR